jgi:hypothetical protein
MAVAELTSNNKAVHKVNSEIGFSARAKIISKKFVFLDS